MTSLAVQLAETVRSFGVASVYGDPVELDGVTIIPVALVKYGFVGGEDGKTDNTAGGGGGGGLTIPIGAYLKTESGVKFQPNIVSLLAVAIPVLWVGGRALSRVIRALKK